MSMTMSQRMSFPEVRAFRGHQDSDERAIAVRIACNAHEWRRQLLSGMKTGTVSLMGMIDFYLRPPKLPEV